MTTKEGFLRRADYRSEVGSSNGSSITAYFDGDPTTSFTVEGAAVGRHQVDLDAGLNLNYDDGQMFVGYQGTMRNNLSDHGLHAGLRFLF